MIFGKDTHLKVGKLIREYGFKKVLIHFGGGSVKRTGLLDTVCRSLEEEGIGYVLLGGVQANPVLSMARKGIELCRREQVDFILAVGGGSVIDSSKCIADGVGNPDVDVWKFHMKEAVPKKAFPVGVILTLAAAFSLSRLRNSPTSASSSEKPAAMGWPPNFSSRSFTSTRAWNIW